VALILTVDDSMFMRNRMRETLRKAGYQTLQASDGQKALEVLAEDLPDCIVLDLLMPNMTGVEVLEVLHARGLQIPVIILTADIQESVREKCLALGVAGFLNKPLKPTELLNTIQNVIKEASNE
jgi:twitching motility two-component system response regulator PilH